MANSLDFFKIFGRLGCLFKFQTPSKYIAEYTRTVVLGYFRIFFISVCTTTIKDRQVISNALFFLQDSHLPMGLQ